MNDRFNATGNGLRDCPVCFRVGALKSQLSDESTLECLGCAARFTFTPPGTLTRLPVPPREREIFRLTPPRSQS